MATKRRKTTRWNTDGEGESQCGKKHCRRQQQITTGKGQGGQCPQKSGPVDQNRVGVDQKKQARSSPHATGAAKKISDDA